MRKEVMPETEPAVLEVTSMGLTEYGKRWYDMVDTYREKWHRTMVDIAELAKLESNKWDFMQKALDEEGCLQNITSGMSQYALQKMMDYSVGKNTTAWNPASTNIALGTAFPTTTTTGAWGSEITTGQFAAYARQVVTAAGWNAATASTPSQSTNNGAITWPAIVNPSTGGSVMGFLIVDSATVGSGNAYWWGQVATTNFSTTNTPLSVANGGLILTGSGV